MLSKFLAAGATLALFFSSAIALDAPVIKDNQPQTVYEAVFQDKDNSTVRGKYTAYGADDGIGIHFRVTLTGVPKDTFLNYHIHDKPVPEDGNCYSTGGHLDPYLRGDQPPCNTTVPETCQVGDISGKHGPVWTADGDFDVLYRDFFLSNVKDTVAFFGNRSVVIHLPDNKRINCGNFHLVSDEEEMGKEAKKDQGC
ncbi:superoxide dismutase [Aspergillus pseudonomiae]|uniref:superoxide dismutase n=1 Tax=Aspergillus pseudonomiae TaxID=1506151 RepID=A0A5N6HPL8_9EURO|nr:superoxide dismutase [Aspergillus pseudonomiae]KAB8255619.1 superoxide dismutase [Aspergillus pseudonomiae]KAE8399870.1 superoxide dismutase [Aspergillus pseudonomiae]